MISVVIQANQTGFEDSHDANGKLSHLLKGLEQHGGLL